MKNAFLIGPIALIASALWLVPDVSAQQTGPQQTGQHPEVGAAKSAAGAAKVTAEAETAIRNAARGFTEAFDRGDAAAVAAHFTAKGVYIDEEGQRFEGRQAIEKEYETLFAVTSDLRMQLEIDTIRLVNATTAVEEGRVALTPQPTGSDRVMSVYSAVHTLQNGKWLMANVRDTRVELPPDHGQLADLGWLVGTWVAENKDTRVEVKGRWVENNHYLARTHTVTESGKVTSTGLEMIGVDARTGQIHSWSFTNDGGHAVGYWAPHDKGWIVESVGLTSDATETTATDTLSRAGEDTLTWKSTDRFVGEATLPDTETVTMKRQ